MRKTYFIYAKCFILEKSVSHIADSV